MPPPEKESKDRKESKDKDKSKVHKLSLKGSAKLVAEFVSRFWPRMPQIGTVTAADCTQIAVPILNTHNIVRYSFPTFLGEDSPTYRCPVLTPSPRATDSSAASTRPRTSAP